MDPKIKKNLISVSANKKIELQGIFEIEKTRANLMSYLETRGFDLSEKDLTQNNQPPNREITVFVDGMRYRDDYFAIWISFKLKMSGKDVEVVENGKTIVKSKGSAQLIASVYLQKDPYGKEPASGFAKFWFNLFNKYHLEHMKADAMIETAQELGAFVKFFKTQVGSKL